MRWYALSETGKEAATCLWAADRLRTSGMAVPARLSSRLASAVAAWRDRDGDTATGPGPLLQANPATHRSRRMTRPEEIVRWAMASGACDQVFSQRAHDVRVPTVVLPDGVDPGMVSAGRHPVWYGGTVAGHRRWDDLSQIGFDAMVAVLACQHLRGRGFVVPDDLENQACGRLEQWLRDVRREQSAAQAG